MYRPDSQPCACHSQAAALRGLGDGETDTSTGWTLPTFDWHELILAAAAGYILHVVLNGAAAITKPKRKRRKKQAPKSGFFGSRAA